jgi:hypothetical protein
VTTLLAPGVSFVFMWPTFVVAAAAAVALAVPRPRVTSAVTWAATAVALFVLVPIVYLAVCKALGVDATGATVLSIFVALSVWLFAPHVESLSGVRLRTAPMIAGTASVVLLLVGAFTVRTRPAHPVGAALVYAVDADSGTAWLTGYGSTESARTWLGRALLATGASSSATPPRWLTRTFNARRIVPAPLSTSAMPVAPTATVVSDTAAVDGRRVTLRIRPTPGTRAIAMSSDSGMILSAAIGGVPIDTRRYRSAPRRWSLEFDAPADSGIVLSLTIVPNAHPTLGLQGRHDGLPDIKDFPMPTRPAGVIPIQDGDMTVVYRRFAL